jgi:hypothetical protein
MILTDSLQFPKLLKIRNGAFHFLFVAAAEAHLFSTPPFLTDAPPSHLSTRSYKGFSKSVGHQPLNAQKKFWGPQEPYAGALLHNTVQGFMRCCRHSQIWCS